MTHNFLDETFLALYRADFLSTYVEVNPLECEEETFPNYDFRPKK